MEVGNDADNGEDKDDDATAARWLRDRKEMRRRQQLISIALVRWACHTMAA